MYRGISIHMVGTQESNNKKIIDVLSVHSMFHDCDKKAWGVTNTDYV